MTGLAVVNGERSALARDEAYFDREQLDLIKSQIAKGCTDAEVAMFVGVCKRLKLDPFAKQIYCIKRREKRDEQWIEVAQTQVSIDGFRVVAERSQSYEGQVGPQWCGEDGVWRDVWLAKEYPSAARVGVWRKGWREPLWGVAAWASFVQTNRDGKPSKMWNTMPDVMLAKCAEAQALRKAFPNDLSGVYTPDEMEQASSEQPRGASSGSPEVRVLGDALHEVDIADPSTPDPFAHARHVLAQCKTEGDLRTWTATFAESIERAPDDDRRRSLRAEMKERAAAVTPRVAMAKVTDWFRVEREKRAAKAAPIEGITDDGEVVAPEEVAPGARAMTEWQSVETAEAAHAWLEDNRAWLAGLEAGSSEENVIWRVIRARVGDECADAMEARIS